MKNTYFLYGIITFALIGIFTIFIRSGIDTTSAHTSKQQARVEAKMMPAKKKVCSCCEDREKRRKRLQKIVQQVHARDQTKKKAGNSTGEHGTSTKDKEAAAEKP